MRRETFEVVVIGGGITGCAIAHYLARAGRRVAVVEQRQIGGAAAAAAAGILAPLAETAQPNPFARLAQAGLRAFGSLAEELREAAGIDIGHHRTGVLRLAPDEAEAANLRQRQVWQAEYGYELAWLDPASAAELEPAATREIVGALYSPEEGSVDAPRLVQAFAVGAARSGATLREGTRIEDLIWSNGRIEGVRTNDSLLVAEHTVLAAGAWSARWAEALGLRVRLAPVRGQVAVVGAPVEGPRRILYLGKNYLVPKPDGTIIVGATQEPEAGFDDRVTLGGIAYLAAAARAMAPGLANATLIRQNAGLRPGSADGWPLLGHLPEHPGVVVASGHFRNGILLSAITGQLVRELIQGEPPAVDLSPFRPDRAPREGAE